MKRTTLFVTVFLSMSVLAQTSKSIEATRNRPLPETIKQQMQLEEDRRVRQEWDREEALAREREERQRQIDEARAERDELLSPQR